jgi:hypothetical protein
MAGMQNQATTAITRQEFGGTELRAITETAAAALAKQAEAETQARYIMAMRNPRDIDLFRDALIKECSRPYFVDDMLKSGTMLKYSVPRGKEQNAQGQWEQKYIEGLSIRFVEVALRCFKNVSTQTMVVFESDDTRIIQVTVTDLENNIPYSQAIVVPKTSERKGFKNKNVWEPPKGRKVISERINVGGEPTYLVEATEDEVLAKQNALISKTIRTLALRILPGDIVEEAASVAEQMIKEKDAKDPDSAKRAILDAFSRKLSIGPKELAAYLGHDLAVLSPKELTELRGVFTALSNGEKTWHEIMATVHEEQNEKSQQDATKATMAEKLRQTQADQKKSDTHQDPGPTPSTDRSDDGNKTEQDSSLFGDQQGDKPKGGFGGKR